MALFDALSELVGAAVLSAAPLCDLMVTPEAMRRRGELARAMQDRGQAGPIVEIIDALAREIWVGSETRGLGQQAIEHHVAIVSAIIAEHGPSRLQLAQAIERARQGGAGGGAAEPSVRRISVDVLARARSAGIIAAEGLKDDVTLFLVDRVFTHLIDEPRTLFAMAPALSDFIAGVPAAGGAVGRSGDAASTGQSGTDALAAFGLSRDFTERLAAAGGNGRITALAERHGLADTAMRRILALVDDQTRGTDDKLARLDDLASWVGQVRAQLAKPSNEDAEIRRLKQKAASALAEGDFEATIDALRQVRRELREGRRRIEERLAEEMVTLKAQMLEEASATARLAELALARGEFSDAAELFTEAALTLPTSDREGIWQFHMQRAEALYRRAEANREPKHLAEALSACNQAVRMVADGESQASLGLASLALGDTLLLMGEDETGVGRLQDAAAAYRKAIASIDRAAEPRAWGRAQQRLGRALALSGERQQASATMREAAEAYREALKEIAADRAPAQYASTMMGLGSVLLALEEREGGTPLLTEAAEAYEAALAVLDVATSATDIAECQLNLGLARLGLGEQQRSRERLEAAAEAFRAALDGYPRQTAAPKWALAQMNLGNVMAALGDIAGDSGAPLLEQAIGAYNSALEVFRRDTEPLKWAITQMNLGTALIRLGERREKRRNWLAAAGALVPALEVFEAQRADAYADVTRRNLKRFHESWETLIAAPEQRPQQPMLRKAG